MDLLVFDRAFHITQSTCGGCFYNSLSQKHHICLDSYNRELATYQALDELRDEGLISEEFYQAQDYASIIKLSENGATNVDN